MKLFLVLSLLSTNAALSRTSSTGSLPLRLLLNDNNTLLYCNASAESGTGTGNSLTWRAIDSGRTLGKFNGRSTVGQLMKRTSPDGMRVIYVSILLEQKNNVNSTQRSSVLFVSDEYSSQRNSIQCKSGRIQDADYFPLIREQSNDRLAELPYKFLFCSASGRYLIWRADGRTIGRFNGHEKPGNSTKSTNAAGTALRCSSILLSRRQNSLNNTERTSLLILSNEFRQSSIQCIGESGNQPIYSVSTQTPSRPVSTLDIGDRRVTFRVETVALNSALCYIVPYRVAFLVAILIIGTIHVL